MLNGQKMTAVLNTGDGIVRLLEDKVTCSYSIGLGTQQGFEFKYISRELHDLLVKELENQEGIK